VTFPRRSAILSAAAVLIAAGAAAPASATTRDQAATAALAALGSSESSNPVVVFGLEQPLRAHTRVTHVDAKNRSRLVLRSGAERSFFFYEDSGSGRVALVGASSGKVRLSKAFKHAPLLNGKLPAFLTSVARYRSAKYRVFDRAAAGTDAVPDISSVFTESTIEMLLAPLTGLQGNTHPKADQQDVRVKQNRAKNITLTGSDADGDDLVYVITQQPDHGTLSGQPPTLTYTPALNYLGKDKFAFKVNDSVLNSNTAHVSIDVVPLGAAPVTTASAGCTDYTERSPSVVVDSLLTVSDPDDAQLDSAKVRISSGLADGDDLLFTDQNGISGSYDDPEGVLTLTGTASIAAYQSALRSVRYRNLTSSSPPPTKAVQFTVNDGGTDSAPATKQICIADSGGSTRPVGETSEGALQYTENDGTVPVDPGFVALDPDSANLSGATIRFAATQPGEDEEVPGGGPGDPVFNFFPDEDELFFSDQNGITGSYDDVNGVLTLTGTATVADYEAAIRSVTYANSSDDPREDARTLRFQLTDSSNATSVFRSRGILITAVNDAPVVTTTEGSTPATGADPSAVIDAALTVIDVDDSDLEGAQVLISGGFVAGDELNFDDQLGIIGSYDADTGVLTLSGTAPVADYETALQSVEYSHPGSNPSGSRTVDFVVNDGDLDSAPAPRGVGVNDAPVVDTTDTALAYTAGDGAVVIDPGVTASDADSTTFSGATVQIADNFSLSEDELAFADQLGITGFYDSESGLLTLSGTASIADYETALSSVTYRNTSANPSTATRTVQFRANDGEASNNISEPATRDVEVSLANELPVVTPSGGTTPYAGSPVAVDSEITVTDADDTNIESAKVEITDGFEAGDQLVFADQAGITGNYTAGTGVLVLSGTASLADYETALRSIQYSNTGAGATVSKTVSFTANDGDVDSLPGLKTIAVPPPPE
jgi:hypothetical protein